MLCEALRSVCCRASRMQTNVVTYASATLIDANMRICTALYIPPMEMWNFAPVTE